MTKVIIHSVIVLIMNGIIVKINYSNFGCGSLDLPQGPLGVFKTHCSRTQTEYKENGIVTAIILCL